MSLGSAEIREKKEVQSHEYMNGEAFADTELSGMQQRMRIYHNFLRSDMLGIDI